MSTSTSSLSEVHTSSVSLSVSTSSPTTLYKFRSLFFEEVGVALADGNSGVSLTCQHTLKATDQTANLTTTVLHTLLGHLGAFSSLHCSLLSICLLEAFSYNPSPLFSSGQRAFSTENTAKLQYKLKTSVERKRRKFTLSGGAVTVRKSLREPYYFS